MRHHPGRPASSAPFLPLLVASLSSAACQQQASARPSADTATTSAGIVVPAGVMHRARAAHTATTLADGRVLVVGGFTGASDSPHGAELYDPAADRFTLTGRMGTLRHSHTATTLPDGRILIAGGYGSGGSYLSSAEVYDPASGAFASTGSMRSARAGQVAVRLRDGRVLLVGGVGTGWTFLSSAEIYDPATGTFAPTGSMGVPRESHVAVLLGDGRVLVVGGHRGRRADIVLYRSVEVFDPATGAFRAAGEMTVRRHKHDAVALPDGRVLITGGSDERDDRGQYDSAEIFDPRTGTAELTGPMRRTRYKHAGTSVVFPGGRVLVAGGAAEAEVHDPATGSFVLVRGGPPMAGQFSATALLPDGRVLMTGGYGPGQGPQRGAWMYRP